MTLPQTLEDQRNYLYLLTVKKSHMENLLKEKAVGSLIFFSMLKESKLKKRKKKKRKKQRKKERNIFLKR